MTGPFDHQDDAATPLDMEENDARFHHRLVWIHAYSNGNGRHARLATDLLLKSLNQHPFSWGQDNLVGRAGLIKARFPRAFTPEGQLRHAE